MRRVLFAFALLAVALPAPAAHAAEDAWSGAWSSLWHNADQRGEALLQAGDAATAAKVYADPRRRAHARLMAGDYAQAAQDLAAFDDGDAHYNRGNALAHAGDLQGALDAYDAALRRDPHNQDARHNREIVANAMKRKPPPPPQESSGKQSKEGNSGGQHGADKTSSSPNQQGQDAQSGSGAQRDKASPQGTDRKGSDNGQGSAKQQEQANQADTQTAASQAAAGNRALGARSAQQGNRPQTAAPASAASPGQDSVEEARRDAAAGLAGTTPDSGVGLGKDSAGNDVGGPPAATFNEHKLAQEQWLRSIPDDPGGLLRRKFLVEHLIRQQKARP